MINPDCILGIDPGRSKCGLAIIAKSTPAPIALEIVSRQTVAAAALRLCEEYRVTTIALGSGTEAKALALELEPLPARVILVNEYGSTLGARSRYFDAHPPRGWKRLLPRGLLIPPEPIDDWAAVIIAERYLQERDLQA